MIDVKKGGRGTDTIVEVSVILVYLVGVVLIQRWLTVQNTLCANALLE